MILEYTCENYRSIKEKVIFSMLASKDNSFENGNVQMELNRCPNCSMVIKPGKKFCSNCGTKV